MRIVTIVRNQVRKYKSERFLEPGEYLVLGRKIEEDTKRKLCAIPTDFERFCWLAPWWPWTEQVMTGKPNRWLHEGIITPKMLKHLKEWIAIPYLHPWQCRYLSEVRVCLESGYAWKDFLITPLGAGKTLLAAILLDVFGGLAIMPKHLKGTFEFECRKFGVSIPKITTPESAKNYLGKKFLCVVLDEALRVKNEDAVRTKVVREIMRNASVAIAMTGTPMGAGRELDCLGITQTVAWRCAPNRRAAIWLFGNNPHFEKLSEAFGVRSEKSFIKFDGFNLDAITAFISPYSHIVPQSEMQDQLPEIDFRKILVPAPSGYDLFRKACFTRGTSAKALSQARQVTDGVYLDDEQKPVQLRKLHKIEWLLEFLKDNPDEAICIVANWQAAQDLVVKSLREAGISVTAVTGSESGNVQDFLDGKSRVFVMSANIVEGYNLQSRCSVLIFVSNSTNPALRKQAIGRVYRPGQKKLVTIIDLLAIRTTDQILLDLLNAHENASQEFIKSQLLENLKGNKK